MDPCKDRCQLGFDKEDCWAVSVGHHTPGTDPPEPHYCKLAERDPGYRDQVFNRTVGQPMEVPASALGLPSLRLPPPPRPVRVGFLCPILLSMGGTETWHRSLWGRLDPRWIRNEGMAVESGEDFIGATADSLRLHAPVESGMRACRDLVDRCDVVVTWGFEDVKRVFNRPRENRPKVVWVCHSDPGCKWCMDQLAISESDCDRFVAVSKAALECVHPRRRGDATVIYNGVDRRRFVDGSLFTRRRSSGRILLYLGRISPEKRPELLLDALDHLDESWEGVYCGVNYMPELVEQAESRHPTRVEFWGPNEGVGATLRAAGVLLNPSPSEGFSYSVAEAWTLGTPVVSTPTGVVAEHTDLVQGVPAHATGLQIARAVNRVVGMPDATRDRCKRARKVARELYNADVTACRWHDYLLETAGFARPKGCGCAQESPP